MKNLRPILLVGCTAVGKSRLAKELAELSPSVIINADAIQVYNCWKILSARPTEKDMQSIRHALFGHVSCYDQYDVGRWLNAVELELVKAKKLNLRPIIVGGTGLYFSLLLEGLANIPRISDRTRIKSEKLINVDFELLLKELEIADPKIFTVVDPSNLVRVKRAWEVLKQTGKSIRYWQQNSLPPLLNIDMVHPIIVWSETNLINKNIDERFKSMISHGVIQEVQNVLNEVDYNTEISLGAFKAIGFKEIKAFINKEITFSTLETEMICKTRQYAKKQRTWYRNKFYTWKPVMINKSTNIKTIRVIINFI